MNSVSGIREEGGCEIGAVGGALEEELRFRDSGEGSFRGEGDLAPTRYEWGGDWEGSGTMFYGRICLKCEGELQFYHFL